MNETQTQIKSDYYNRDTIDAKLDSIHETAIRIEAQTTKTNGRVTQLELENARRLGTARVWAVIVSFITSLIIAVAAAILSRI